MTAERDRLIELLRDWTDFAPNLADALLAAGVHLEQVTTSVYIHDHGYLDVERLARALRVHWYADRPLIEQGGGNLDDVLAEDARIIAAAYREDAERGGGHILHRDILAKWDREDAG